MRLFEPIRINRLTIPNRIVMPAMALFYTRDYTFTTRFKAFYQERACGGVGLMIVGPVAIDKVGSNQFMPGMFLDEHIEPIKNFVRELHERVDAAIGVQLMHQGRIATSRLTGLTPIAPSAIPSPITGEMPREMDRKDIEEVKNAFATAALRAQAAGFDYIEILAAGSYLIGEFLSPLTNQRNDEYGGSQENRMRFALEIINSVRGKIGIKHALGIRVSGHDYMSGGKTIVDSIRFCEAAERAGIDCINVTGGWHETRVPQITSDVPQGAFVYLATSIKAKVTVPVFASNRLGNPEMAEKVLRSDAADMICWGRPLITDPYLPKKVKEYRLGEIIPCIGCNQGCLDAIFSDMPVFCTLNPRVGREEEIDTDLEPAKVKKKVYVAGGGPAGLQFAITASQKGHQVFLYERTDILGGQINLAGAIPGKDEFLNAVECLKKRVRSAGVNVRIGTNLTAKMIHDERPDILAIATGSISGEIVVPGIELPHVVNARNILNGTISHIGHNIVIVGAGSIGCETGLFLAHLAIPDAKTFTFLSYYEAESPDQLRSMLFQTGRCITIIEITGRAAANAGPSTRWALLKKLKLMGIQLKLNTRLLRIEKDMVSAETPTGIEQIPADMVVLATGSRSLDILSKETMNSGIRTFIIGDAKEPRKIGDAVREGFDSALKV